MTCLYLIRHGATDAIGSTFSGRLPGIDLNIDGRRQAEILAQRLREIPIQAIFSSPCDRARQTSEIIGAASGLKVEELTAFDEIDIGEWSGRAFSDLKEASEFRLFNSVRSLTRPPSGELMLEVQSRAVAEILRIAPQHSNGTIAIVTHADVIKAVLAYFLGIPLDLAYRLVIGIASVSVVELDREHVQVVRVNG